MSNTSSKRAKDAPRVRQGRPKSVTFTGPDHSSFPCISDGELDSMLAALDAVTKPLNTESLGPFSIFQTQSGVRKTFIFNGTHLQANVEHGFPTSDDSFDYVSSASGFQIQTSANALAPLHEERATEVSISATSHTKWMASVKSITPGFELLVSLFHDKETSMLMYHYTTHVAELLQPVLHPKNPWRTTYFQFALEGCTEPPFGQTAISTSKVSTAIFHSVLSSAAFHLRNATAGSTRYHRLGLQHRAQALKALKSALAHPCDSHTYIGYLTAMLSLVTIDTMTGEDADFPIHLNGCHDLRRRSHDRISGDQNRQVGNICHFLTLLARTTSYQLRNAKHQSGFLFDNSYFHIDDKALEHMYGITPALGNMLQRACDLSEYLSTYNGEDAPVAFFQSSEALKVDLLAWRLDSKQFSLLGSGIIMAEIARCQARAFHSAVLIFFYRNVEMNRSLELNHEVNSILKSLTVAENLKDEYMKGEKRSAPMSWPAFIGACDATDRKPWEEWWTRVQDYRIGNYKKQWEVIQEIWRIMDEDVSVTGWKEALHLSGKLVLPI
ncbi:hypothetical protein N7448_010708 [Penicillium atrosanguineum]|nr:hypothetical protein N7448_010708 [Penicillium atrosanguineum]